MQVEYHADGSGTVTVNGEKHEFTAEQMANLVIVTGDGDDNVEVLRNGHSMGRTGLTIDTGDGNDNIEGGNGAETIHGGDGDDYIDARGGNDSVHGGNGDDRISTGSGHDEVFGGDGEDDIDTGTGNDSIDGGAGADDIDAGDGNDSVRGGDATEVDIIELGLGHDTYDRDKPQSFADYCRLRPDQVTDTDAA